MLLQFNAQVLSSQTGWLAVGSFQVVCKILCSIEINNSETKIFQQKLGRLHSILTAG